MGLNWFKQSNEQEDPETPVQKPDPSGAVHRLIVIWNKPNAYTSTTEFSLPVEEDTLEGAFGDVINWYANLEGRMYKLEFNEGVQVLDRNHILTMKAYTDRREQR